MFYLFPITFGILVLIYHDTRLKYDQHISLIVHKAYVCTVCIHIVTIGDQLDELCSFSGSLPHVYLLILTKLLYVTLHVGKQNMID